MTAFGPLSDWLIATDFDGTLTRADVGNALCERVIEPHFKALHKRYKSGELTLRAYQELVWTGFPLREPDFRSLAAELGGMRPGVNEFLENCARQQVPVLVLSCGIQAYIEAVAEKHLTPLARSAIKGLACNGAQFGAAGIERIITPDNDPSSPVPLHKGRWVAEQRSKYPKRKVLAIGNGSSDHSFAGHVDALAATESLATWCDKHSVKYTPFKDFLDVARFFQS